MLKIRHVEELSRQERACIGRVSARNTIIVTASRAGELAEPRHFLRRAIYLVRHQTRRNNHELIAVKTIGLIGGAVTAAQRLRSWSTAGSYDPLPDIITLKEQAQWRLGRRSGAPGSVAGLKALLDGMIAAMEGTTPEQRMGCA